jgi:hypothetical protein
MRYCTSCRQNVYNLSAMSRNEAEALIIQKEGRLCVRFFRRADGTVLTQDCPVGMRAWRRRIRTIVTLAAGLLLMAFGLTAHSAQSRGNSITRIEPIRTILDWIDPDGNLPGNHPCIMGAPDPSCIPISQDESP